MTLIQLLFFSLNNSCHGIETQIHTFIYTKLTT